MSPRTETALAHNRDRGFRKNSSSDLISARAHCFTLNNYKQNDIDILVRNGPLFQYLIFSREIGDSGTPHLQGYIQPGEKVGRKKCQQLLCDSTIKRRYQRFAVFIAKGDALHNKAYISKAPIGLVFEFGKPGEQGKSGAIQLACDDIKEGTDLRTLVDKHTAAFAMHHRGLSWIMQFYEKNIAEPRELIIIIGPTGIGKSRYCHEHYPGAFWITNPNSETAVFFDSYIDQSVIILDEFGHGYIPWSLLLRLIDRYPIRVNTKGGTIRLQHTTVVITSNESLDTWYPGVYNKKPLIRRIMKVLHPADLEVRPNITLTSDSSQQTGPNDQTIDPELAEDTQHRRRPTVGE